MKYLTSAEAKALDEHLISPEKGAFSLEQLMELAGLSVAEAVFKHYIGFNIRVLIICGPGNQGSDGLVAARHLSMWRFNVTLCIPKESTRAHDQRLLKQA